MSKITVKIKKLDHFDESLEMPEHKTAGAAGADIRASLPDKTKLQIGPGKRVLVPTGLAMAIPEGYEIQVRPRSGLSLKTDLLIANAPGTVDSDYRGEVCVIMFNAGDDIQEIQHGERVAQLVLAPVIQAGYREVEELDETERGAGGFGSTGKK